jgi:hypothetical protein
VNTDSIDNTVRRIVRIVNKCCLYYLCVHNSDNPSYSVVYTICVFTILTILLTKNCQNCEHTNSIDNTVRRIVRIVNTQIA